MKGIQQDFNEIKLNSNYMAWAKNVVMSENFGSLTNELGSILHSDIGANKIIIGVLPVNEYSIIFAKTEISSEIGVLSDTGYTTVSNNTNINPNLNFDTDYPIRADYQFNNKGECIVAFTDNLNKPKVANIGLLQAPSYIEANDIKDILMFPEGSPAQFTTIVLDNGGSLEAGVYYVSYAYKNKDTQTPYFQLSKGHSIQDDKRPDTFYDGVQLATPTSKSIQVDFTGLDTSYNKVVIAVVYDIGTGTLANEVGEYTINSANQSIIITTLDGTQVLEPDEVIVPRPLFTKVKTLTRLNDRLYVGNVQTENDIDWQSEATNVRINYFAAAATFPTTTNLSLTNGDKAAQSNQSFAGFIPGEVYAFYIRLWYSDGTYSRQFHIPGRAPLPSDLSTVTLTGYGNIETYKVDQQFDVTAAQSNMGFWQNDNELYPSNFPGGLAGEKVRHHRMPTLNYLHSNNYSGSTAFGTDYLPLIGVNVSNVNNLPDNCTHWELGFARRTDSNSLIAGYSLGIYAAHPYLEGAVDQSRYHSSGGNWNTDYAGTLATVTGGYMIESADRSINTFDHLRLNSPEFQENKPIIFGGSSFIRREYILQTQINNTNSTLNGNGARRKILADYTSDDVNATSTVYTTGTNILIDKSEYLNNNSIGVDTSFYNVYGEETLYLKLHQEAGGLNAIQFTGVNDEGVGRNITTQAYMMSVVRIISDAYRGYDIQDVIPCGRLIPANTSTGIVYGGDCYNVDYSYITYAMNTPRNNLASVEGAGKGGVRAVNRYLVPSAFNYNLRHTLTNNIYSRYYPQTSLDDMFDGADGSTDAGAHDYDVTIEPNQVAYNSQYHFVGVTKPSVIYNPDDDIVTKFPVRIAASQVFNPEDQENNWKKWLALDYYEHTERGRGDIINLQGYNTELLIHQERGLFITKGRTQLDTAAERLTISSGQLFDVLPQEIIPTSTGYCGTLHQFSCNLNKLGYCFIDALQGKVFIYNGQLNEISNKGLRNFFADHLTHRETIHTTTTRNIPATYNVTLDRTTIPKFQIEYTVNGLVYYDIIPPSGYLNELEYYYTPGNSAGTLNLTVVSRYNKLVYDDNPFKGNGYSITWDERFSRLLLLKTKDCNVVETTRLNSIVRERFRNIATRNVTIPVSTTATGSDGATGEGIVDSALIPLDSSNGGVFWVDFTPLGAPDKLEIIHNGQVVAYSTVNNYIPSVDGAYFPPGKVDQASLSNSGIGSMPTRSAAGAGALPVINSNTTGTDSSSSSDYDHIGSDSGTAAWSEWFIGQQRLGGGKCAPLVGSIPTRTSEFVTDTGITHTFTPGATQRIWFKYSSFDYTQDSNVIVRVTGVSIYDGSTDVVTQWSWDAYQTDQSGVEYYNGTSWQNNYTEWITETVQVTADGSEDSFSSTAFYQYFDGNDYFELPGVYANLAAAQTFVDANVQYQYTQWDSTGLGDWVNYEVTYLDCSAEFVITDRIKGYFISADTTYNNKELSNGDILLTNTGTEISPVYEYREYENGSLIFPRTKDEFILSYSPQSDMWVSSHSYRPKFLFSTYNKYYSLADNEVYLMNNNLRTNFYYGGTTYIEDAFIDIIFNSQEKVLYSGFNWNTDVFDENSTHIYDETVNRVRVYTQAQTTPEVTLVPLKNVRKTFSEWNFNQIRDDNRYNRAFNRNVLDNYELIVSEIQNKLAHKRQRIINEWCVVRLIIRNDNEVVVHEVNPIIKPVYR